MVDALAALFSLLTKEWTRWTEPVDVEGGKGLLQCSTGGAIAGYSTMWMCRVTYPLWLARLPAPAAGGYSTVRELQDAASYPLDGVFAHAGFASVLTGAIGGVLLANSARVVASVLRWPRWTAPLALGVLAGLVLVTAQLFTGAARVSGPLPPFALNFAAFAAVASPTFQRLVRFHELRGPRDVVLGPASAGLAGLVAFLVAGAVDSWQNTPLAFLTTGLAFAFLAQFVLGTYLLARLSARPSGRILRS